MDMREMVDKVKKGQPLYGQSILTEYMQGVSARNSRYSQVFLHVVPWFNIVNHNEVCRLAPRNWEASNKNSSMVLILPSTISKPKPSWPQRESLCKVKLSPELNIKWRFLCCSNYCLYFECIWREGSSRWKRALGIVDYILASRFLITPMTTFCIYMHYDYVIIPRSIW